MDDFYTAIAVHLQRVRVQVISGNEVILQIQQQGSDDATGTSENRQASDYDKAAKQLSDLGFIHPESNFSFFNKSGLTPKTSNNNDKNKKKKAPSVQVLQRCAFPQENGPSSQSGTF